jgi:hypothetical protein
MNVINKIFILIALLVASSFYSQTAYSETGLRDFDGMSKSIAMIDHKKDIIKLADTEFAYDKKTVIVNNKGEKVTEDALKKGDRVSIRLNTSQRYISRPLLRHIQIESGD